MISMKSSILAKKFFKAFENYYNAASILENKSNEIELVDIIYPAAYLLRHSAELLLKSLICSYATEQSIIIKNKRTYLNTLTEEIYLEGHSLLTLYYNLLKVGSSRLLTEIPEDKELIKMLKSFEKKDKTGEYYKYPISVKNPSSKIKMFKINEIEVSPDLGKSQNLNIMIDDEKVFVAKGYDREIRENIVLLGDIINKLIVYYNGNQV